jgi:hypothetical protein
MEAEAEQSAASLHQRDDRMIKVFVAVTLGERYNFRRSKNLLKRRLGKGD